MHKNNYHIFAHSLCPYVQRVVILMSEKHISYKRTNIELHNKPHWLATISPTGKVPILLVNGTQAIFESSVICEYLNEVSPNSLHPSAPLQIAHHRAWIAFAGDILNAIAAIIYSDKSIECTHKSLVGITEKLAVIDNELPKGQYFSGDTFHIIDGVYATVFRYFELFEQLSGVNLYSNLPHIKRWSVNLLQRDSVKEAVPKNYNELLLAFMKKADSYIVHADFS